MRLLFTYITTMAFLFTQVAYGDAVIFSGNDVKTLKPNIQLFNQAKIMSGTVDPSSSATSANTGSLYLNTSNGNTYRKLDSGSSTNWSVVGSSGSSGINYVTNPDIESSATGYATYADAAAATPVDGTGGTPNVTATRTTSASEVQRGAGSLKFSKDAADRQGQGFSFDIKLSAQDRDVSKAIIVSFEYKTSAAYVNEDVQLFAYDKDGATLLGPLFNNEQGKLRACPQGGCRVTGVFYSVAGNDDYRVIAHVASTNASAYDIFADTFRAGPDITVPGAIVADLGTETWTDNQANATTSVKVLRFGNVVRAIGKTSFTGAMSGNFLLTIPAAYAPSSRYDLPTNDRFDIGSATLRDTGTGFNFGRAVLLSSTSIEVYSGATYTSISATSPFTWASGDHIDFDLSWEVSGWAASAALSTTEAMLTTAKARYARTTQSIPSGVATILDADTKTHDTLNSVTTGASWKFTAPRSGYYKASCTAQYVARSYAAGQAALIQLYKNGVFYSQGSATEAESATSIIIATNHTDTVYLAKGEFIDFRAYNEGSTSTNTDGFHISVEEVPDFSTFSVYGNFELLTATSAVKTPTASDNFQQLTGNSITLTPGTWKLFGAGLFTDSGGSPQYTRTFLGWYSANGADSGTTPTALSSASGLTIVSTSGQVEMNNALGGSVVRTNQSGPTVVVRVTQPVTVYLVSLATMTTAANARVTVYANAERLQ